MRADGTIVSVTYAADGNRVGKIHLDASQSELRRTTYLVDVNNHTGYAQVVEQRENSGSGFALEAVYVYGHDLISQVREQGSGQELIFYLYDGHGTVRGLADAAGSVTDSYEYDAFGVLLDSSGSTKNDYLYTGEQYDSDLGMYFLRARYLNTRTGRFHNMDTYGGRNGEPLTLHKYLYAHNNPVNLIDPTGHTVSLVELQFVAKQIAVLSAIAVPAIYVAQETSTRLRTLNFGVRTRADATALSRSKRGNCRAIIGETFFFRVLAALRKYPGSETFNLPETINFGRETLLALNRAWIRRVMFRKCQIIDIGFDADRGDITDPHTPNRGIFYLMEKEETALYPFKTLEQFPPNSAFPQNR